MKNEAAEDPWTAADRILRDICERHGPAINGYMAVLLGKFPGFLEYGNYESVGIYST